MRRRQRPDETADPTPTLAVPAAGFDFTGGAYFAGRRQASTSKVLAIGAAVLVATPAVLGGLAMQETRQLQQQTVAAEERTDETFVELATLTGLSGTTPEAIDTHRAARAQLVSQPLATQLAYGRVLSDLQDVIPPGVTVTAITLSPVARRGAAAAAPSPAAPDVQAGSLQVSGVAADQAAETAWEDAIASLPYVVQPLTNYANLGSETRDLTFSTTAELNAAALTDLLPVVAQLLAADTSVDDLVLFSDLPLPEGQQAPPPMTAPDAADAAADGDGEER